METIDDNSYNIKELEVDPSWANDFKEDYLEYRKIWSMASDGHLFDFPLFLEVESTYACNYRCPKCPRTAIMHEGKSGSLSPALFDKLFAEAARYKLPSITFSHGGEPLMRSDLAQLVAKARDAGIIDRMIHTNGYLLDYRRSVDLLASGLTKINISLDAASPEVYDRVRPGGDYQTVVDNVESFLRAKRESGKSYPRVRVSFVVSEENRHEQARFYDLWKDKVNVISFQKMYDFEKSHSDTGAAAKDCSAMKYRCSQLTQLLTVNCNGDIYICEHDYNREYVLGNLATHTIHECWHSEQMNRFRELHKNNRFHEIAMCCKCVSSVNQE